MMEPTWNEKQRRWIASTGSGRHRRWAKCRIEGEQGRKICALRLKSLQEELDGPPPILPGSFAQFVEEVWWPRMASKEPSTKDTYRQRITNHLACFFPMQISKIGLEQVQPWINGLNQKLAPKTVNECFSLLEQILSLAKAMKRTEDESWRLAEPPEVPVSEVVRLETEELRRLLGAIKGHWMEGPVWCSAMFGLRKCEVLGLKPTDIEILEDSAWITIRKKRGSHGESNKLKNKRRGQHRKFRVPKDWGLKLLSFWNGESMYLFASLTGKPIYHNAPTKEFPKLCETAGIKRYQFKHLRSTCASMLKDIGADQETRMQILGHTTVEAHEKYIKDSGVQTLTAYSRLEAM